MIKKIKRDVLRKYRLVKKFSNHIEACLAEEILNLYHVKVVVVRHYHEAHSRFEQGLQRVYLMVLPQDYQLAHRLLYTS